MTSTPVPFSDGCVKVADWLAYQAAFDIPAAVAFNLDAAVAFTEPGCRGDSQRFQPGRYNLANLTISNDSIRSVTVPKGWRVTLFEHADFSGAQAIIEADTGNLGGEIDGRTSSLIVENTLR
ncbi:hypothetical protein OG730_08705 [Streptomyces sp. NBC_01298]|uniref:hypothetical protein n=1 Tax=Streptomyces sp. NBC_01298 TaxID=2903817 RepID=UPI002E138A23|nr:hypothetical protein OG730_08705 [Streptomyces sp. NBC_01298]